MFVTGSIEKFADISPDILRMSGIAANQFERIIKITPKKKYPFKIVGVKTKNKNNIRCRVEEIKNKEGLEYRIIVNNINLKKGKYEDTIIIKTTSEIRPEIKISVLGRIRESIAYSR